MILAMILSTKFDFVARKSENSNVLGDLEWSVPSTVEEIVIGSGEIGVLVLALLATVVEPVQKGLYSLTPLIRTVVACIARVGFDVTFVAIDEPLVIVGHSCSAVVAARASCPFHIVVDKPEGRLTVVIHVLATE